MVIKSQVLTGGRMKAGGVKFADTPDAAAEHASAILELEINGHMPRGVLVDPKAEVGGYVEEPMESVAFGRIAAQQAKQVIVQKVREAERAQVVEAYKDRVEFEIVQGQKGPAAERVVKIGR